jgi:predicted Fe-S protein YdhL (DUF1289 family)
MSTFPKLSFACPIPWSELCGDERSRFCEKCGRTITNLSELSEEERRAVLSEPRVEELCVTYYRRLSGEFVTPGNPLTQEERSKIKQLGVAALSAGALALAAGCMSAPAKQKMEPKEQTQTQPSSNDGDGVVVLQPFGVMADPPRKK